MMETAPESYACMILVLPLPVIWSNKQVNNSNDDNNNNNKLDG